MDSLYIDSLWSARPPAKLGFAGLFQWGWRAKARLAKHLADLDPLRGPTGFDVTGFHPTGIGGLRQSLVGG